MRLLCDEMLGGLGRWLRAAGHDTVIAENGVSDPDLIARAVREKRALLTRDRHLERIALPSLCPVLLESDSLDAQARALRDRLGLDWLLAPFTRCMIDNAKLLPAGPHHAVCVPETARTKDDALRVCPACGRVYWPGGHVRRMRKRLENWQADAGAQSPPSS
jgi:uncharacterized protein with PIN domain